MKKAIVVNPETRTIDIVEKAWTLKELQAEVGGFITDGSGRPRTAVFVDDEGLLKGEPRFFFDIPGLTREKLTGKGVVLCVDGEGETKSIDREVMMLALGVRFYELRR